MSMSLLSDLTLADLEITKDLTYFCVILHSMSKENENTRSKSRAKSATNRKARGNMKTKNVEVKKDDFEKLLSQMIKDKK